jgi:hypothetical protein
MNEFCGAFGPNFTFEEMKWLAHWLLVRGCNLLVPHAFFYSIRGPRIDERPPDVGPNNTWWPQYRPFAQATSRLCWLNTDSTHVWCGDPRPERLPAPVGEVFPAPAGLQLRGAPSGCQGG